MTTKFEISVSAATFKAIAILSLSNVLSLSVGGAAALNCIETWTKGVGVGGVGELGIGVGGEGCAGVGGVGVGGVGVGGVGVDGVGDTLVQVTVEEAEVTSHNVVVEMLPPSAHEE